MRKFAVLSMLSLAAATGGAVFPMSAMAQGAASQTNNPFLDRVTIYRSDVDALVKKCDLDKMKALGAKLTRLTEDLKYEHKTNMNIFEITQNLQYQKKADQILEALKLARVYRGTYLDACRRLDPVPEREPANTELAKTKPQPAELKKKPTDTKVDKKANDPSRWLIGDWAYKGWNGGTIGAGLRFEREVDGSISAHLIAVTPEMHKKGYRQGMPLLRGIKDTSHKLHPKARWSGSAMVGEIFSPRDPKRRSGDIYGRDHWKKGSVIFVNKKTGELGGATGFGNRLNWHRGKMIKLR